MFHGTRRQSTRKTGGPRYNQPGTFVSATNDPNFYQEEQFPMQQEPIQQNQWNQGIQAPTANVEVPFVDNTVTQAAAANNNFQSDAVITVETEDDVNGKPKRKWPSKGIKPNMREKRRRQNMQLRRLLTPKNAQMVLNELAPGTQQECTILPDEIVAFGPPVNKQYVAVVNVDGVEYKGMGTSKINAKTVAAENAIRDMMIKQMSKISQPESMTTDNNEEDTEQQLPMMQLASYALHKLFSEWQAEGYKVPQLSGNKAVSDPSTTVNENSAVPPTSGTGKAKKPPTMPQNPESFHPCMLLGQMRPGTEYVLIGSEEVRPNSRIFTMGVTVDGSYFIGKGPNKKEARKAAAKMACEGIFKIQYPEVQDISMEVM